MGTDPTVELADSEEAATAVDYLTWLIVGRAAKSRRHVPIGACQTESLAEPARQGRPCRLDTTHQSSSVIGSSSSWTEKPGHEDAAVGRCTRTKPSLEPCSPH